MLVRYRGVKFDNRYNRYLTDLLPIYFCKRKRNNRMYFFMVSGYGFMQDSGAEYDNEDFESLFIQSNLTYFLTNS